MTNDEFYSTRGFLRDQLNWEDQVLRKSVTKLNGLLIKSDVSSGDALHKLLKIAQKQQGQISKMIGIDESLFWLDEMYENEKEDEREDKIEKEELKLKDYELWYAVKEELHKHYPCDEARPGLIEIFVGSFTFELRNDNHSLTYYRVPYNVDHTGKLAIDWNSLEQIGET